MFNKELFLSLCEKYDVEFSKTATGPMIKDGDDIHEITCNDIKRIFSTNKTYFDYSNNKTNIKNNSTFYIQENYATAC